MKDTDLTNEKPTARPLFPELDAGLYTLAIYLNQYIQSIRQTEKRPAPATR